MDPVQPDPMQPDPVQPDPMQPDPVQPDPMQPDPMQPDPLQPDPLQPDPLELEPILAELVRPLLRYCLGRTGDLGLAEEAAQEALTALVSRWRRVGAPESPAAFAFAIARRKAWRLLLRRRLSLPLTLLSGTASPDPDPEAEALGRSELRRAHSALGLLRSGDREALLLVVAGELPLAEGARLLSISVPALKMRLHRARRRLAGFLEENDGPARRPVADPHA